MLAGGCPVQHGEKRAATEAATAPVSGTCADEVNPLNQMHIEERQQPAPGQKKPLPKDRITSSIPKSDFSPGHQEPGKGSSHVASVGVGEVEVRVCRAEHGSMFLMGMIADLWPMRV